MSERLLSVGLDVGTTSTQLILSALQVENQASGFAVPEMRITRREILYKSPVYFTPQLDEGHMDGEGIRQILEREYRAAGIRREDVDTGAVIITGETSRKENARTVLDALSDCAGDFVVATAGPALESILAAKGAGATDYSEKTGETVLHMDIGGGTGNLALIQKGAIVATGCLNVGGRLLKFDENGIIIYVSPVLKGIFAQKAGEKADQQQLNSLAETLVQALEMAAGLRDASELLEKLWTKELDGPAVPLIRSEPEKTTLSFSGGVADCILRDRPWLEFGDIGPLLGRAIRESRLCRGKYRLGDETIRATVIGAGCHSTQLSGSTVFCRNMKLPLKNIPVAKPERTDPDSIRRAISGQEERAFLALPALVHTDYRQIRELADRIAAAAKEGPVLICLEQDMAKALGQALALRLEPDRPVLCIDRIRLPEGSYLDVGLPTGPAFPVVIKTLVMESGTSWRNYGTG